MSRNHSKIIPGKVDFLTFILPSILVLEDPKVLSLLKITHILSIGFAKSLVTHVIILICNSNLIYDQIPSMAVDLKDEIGADLFQHLDSTFDYIDQTLANPENVIYIHWYEFFVSHF